MATSETPSAQRPFFIGSDHAGFHLKEIIKQHLLGPGDFNLVDLGTTSESSVDYPDIAISLARHVQASDDSRGILICGTGVGMSISANRFRGVRAAHATDPFTAAAAKAHNNANVLCLGSRVTGVELALAIVDAWVNATFEGGRHARRINKIDNLGE